jgi:adenylosuccinate lyase
MVQGHAMRAWKEGLNFRALVLNDPEITRYVRHKQIEAAFNLKRQLRNVDKIFARVFPENGRTPIHSRKGSAQKREKEP